MELKDYKVMCLTPDEKNKHWSRKDGLKIASLMVAQSRQHLTDFYDILLAIDDMTPQGIDYCIFHYHIARVILMDLHKALLINERVECGVEIKRKEINPIEKEEIREKMHKLVDTWF